MSNVERMLSLKTRKTPSYTTTKNTWPKSRCFWYVSQTLKSI